MKDGPQLYVVKAYLHNIRNPVSWGPFADLLEAQRCIVSLARNRSVIQAILANYPEDRPINFADLKKVFEKRAEPCQS